MAIRKVRIRPEGENNYADVLHPETSADVVIESENKMFVSSAEKANWNNKADRTYVDTELNKRYLKEQVFTKEEVLQKIQNIIGTAPEALDTLQEIAKALNNDENFAGTITNELSKKVDKIVGKQLSTEDYTTAEKNKLAGIADGANKYIHPSSHPASMITQDSTHRFVSDTEKSTWNNKAEKNAIPTKTSQLENDSGFVTQDGIVNKAEKLTNAITILNYDTLKPDSVAQGTITPIKAPNTANSPWDNSTSGFLIQSNYGDSFHILIFRSGGDGWAYRSYYLGNWGSWKIWSTTDHTHDDRYYTETEINTMMNGKSNITHTHDDRYYTEGEINSKFVKKTGDTMTGALTVPNLIAQINIPSSSPPSAWPAGFVAGVVYSNGYPVQFGTIFSYKGTSNNSVVQLLQAWPANDGGEAYLYIRSARDVADVFGSWRKVWSENNDGTGSGLDADLLDGKHASNFASASHDHTSITGNARTATKLATPRTISLTGDATGSTTYDGSSNSIINVTIADDSHNHIIANVDNLQTTLDKKVDTNDYTMIVPYVATTGSANTYVATLSPAPTLVEGLALAVKINVTNTGASTINVNNLGAKSILKSNGNAVSSGNLKAGSIYTLRYNGKAFILQGEGGEYGTATPDKVLSGYTIGTENGIVSGTMPNNSGKLQEAIATYSQEGFVRLRPPKGYYDGVSGSSIDWTDGNFKKGNIKSGVTIFGQTGTFTSDATATASQILSGKTAYVKGNKITGTMPNNGAKIITPSTTNQAIPVGYHNGSGYVKGDANLKPENIKKGVSIFGVTGNVTIKSLGGYGVGDRISSSKYNREILETEWSFTGHTDYVDAVAVDNNGYVYSGGDDKTVRKISPNGNQVWSFTGHTAWINTVAVDNNGYVYSGDWDGIIRKISPSGSQVWSFTGHTAGQVIAVAVDNNGYVYSCSNDKTVKKIDPNGNREVWSFTGHTDGVRAVAVDNDGYVYSGGLDKTVRKISPSGSQVWSFTGHTDTVMAVAVDNNGYVYSGSFDDTVRKISPNGSQVWSFTGHTDYVDAVAVDNDGYVCSTSGDDTLRKIDPNGNQVLLFTDGIYIRTVAVDNNGYIFISSNNKTVRKIFHGIEILK